MTDQSSHVHLDPAGVLRVGKVGIMLDDVAEAHEKGHTPEALLARFPGLTSAELEAAFDYCQAQSADAEVRGLPSRDADWKKWNNTLCDDSGTDTPPNAPIAGCAHMHESTPLV